MKVQPKNHLNIHSNYVYIQDPDIKENPAVVGDSLFEDIQHLPEKIILAPVLCSPDKKIYFHGGDFLPFTHMSMPWADNQDLINQYPNPREVGFIRLHSVLIPKDLYDKINQTHDLTVGDLSMVFLDGWHYYYDKAELFLQRRIFLEEFKKMKFDIILCTLQEHEYTLRGLWQKYQPQAKYIRLTGNVGEQVNWDNFYNYIDTSGLYRPPASVNSVVINQEFPLDHFFYQDPANHRRISNFMNNLKETPALQVWEALKPKLLDFDFKMHGSNGDDGMIDGLNNLGQAMRESAFIFQIKHHGEGFCHVIHNAYACGRPVITLMEHYKGKLAEKFLRNDYSAIVIDDYDLDTLVKKIRYWSIPENHLKMCRNAYNIFKETVDFNEDEVRFREFMKKLK